MKVYCKDMPIKEAAGNILKEIAFYEKHNMKRTPEQIAGLIVDYSDNEERTFALSLGVWAELKKQGLIK